MYNNAYTPPVNNLLQPDIYNRLDAETIEKTRVANTQLDERLRAQQRIISKYRLAAERVHRREEARVKEELVRISTKLPAASRIRDFRSKFLYGLRRNSMPASLQSERRVRGVPEEKADLPFCERYFIHHLPTKKKFYKRRTPTPPLHAVRHTDGQGANPNDVVASSLPVTGEAGDLTQRDVTVAVGLKGDDAGIVSGADSGVGTVNREKEQKVGTQNLQD
nr:hypothetical protein BaRGS_007435 [Batillaria attramentaria]